MTTENPITAPQVAAPEVFVPAVEAASALSLKARLLAVLAHPRAPLIVGIVIALGVAGVVAQKLRIPVPFGRPAIVLFDPVRFINAQRAAASIMAMSPSADISLTLTQVARQSEAVIREEARGAVVLVKQSVVLSDDLPDITDAVLERFGLPTVVPTVSTKPSHLMLEGLAPTDSSLSAGKLREDYRLELRNRSQQLLSEDGKRDRQSQVLP